MREIQKAVQLIKQGGVIAYPTEAVFGLGCDPFNEIAVNRLLKLKNREPHKGLILIAADWEQVKSLADHIPEDRLKQVLDTWPGPVTWIFPATFLVPEWIRGHHSTIAIRVTNHPVAHGLCHHFGKPLVSTSANIEGHEPARKEEEVKKIFDNKIDFIVAGALGNLNKPTPIRDALTGKFLRE